MLFYLLGAKIIVEKWAYWSIGLHVLPGKPDFGQQGYGFIQGYMRYADLAAKRYELFSLLARRIQTWITVPKCDMLLTADKIHCWWPMEDWSSKRVGYQGYHM